jgi:hypothetical protein
VSRVHRGRRSGGCLQQTGRAESRLLGGHHRAGGVPARIEPTSGGTAHLRQRAKEHSHQISPMTPMALDAGQPCDYGLAVEMLIHNDNLHQARARPSPP